MRGSMQVVIWFCILSVAVGSMVKIHVYQAPLPLRQIFSLTYIADESWTLVESFYAFDDGSEAGTVKFNYCENQDPLRGMVIPDGAAFDGWVPKFSFWMLAEEHWCSCKLFISQSGYLICTGGPPSADLSAIDQGTILNTKDAPAELGLLCNNTNDCKCVYPEHYWTAVFASGGAENSHGCMWPHITPTHPAYPDWNLDNYYQDTTQTTENIAIGGITWSILMEQTTLTTYWAKLSMQMIIASLNFANGGCGACTDPSKQEICDIVKMNIHNASSKVSSNLIITEREWEGSFKQVHQTLYNFSNGIPPFQFCGPLVFDDELLGRGCCTKCPRPYEKTTQGGSGLTPTDPYRLPSSSDPVTSPSSDPHRMILDPQGFSALTDWCPRLSFWSPCSDWNSLYY